MNKKNQLQQKFRDVFVSENDMYGGSLTVGSGSTSYPNNINSESSVEEEESCEDFGSFNYIPKRELLFPVPRIILGEGGFAIVEAAIWKNKKKEVAVKTIDLKSPSGSVAKREIILEEFRIQVDLQHENIVEAPKVCVEVFGYCCPDSETVQIIMEKMDMNLFSFVSSEKRTINEKLYLMKKMIKSVHFLHSRTPPIIHRDIKSTNFLVSEDGKELKICDFGVAKVKGSDNTFTHANGVKGTFGWLAPECYEDDDPEDAKTSVLSDIFALAMTFYEVLYGKKPFDSSERVVLVQVAMGKRPDFDPKIPLEGMEKMIERMWNQEPVERPKITELKEWFERNEEKWKNSEHFENYFP